MSKESIVPVVILLALICLTLVPVFAIGSLLNEVTYPPYVDSLYVVGRWMLGALYILALGITVGVLYFGYAASYPEQVVAVILGSALTLLVIMDAMQQFFLVGVRDRKQLERWKAAVFFAIYLMAFAAYAYLFFDRVGTVGQILSS